MHTDKFIAKVYAYLEKWPNITNVGKPKNNAINARCKIHGNITIKNLPSKICEDYNPCFKCSYISRGGAKTNQNNAAQLWAERLEKENCKLISIKDKKQVEFKCKSCNSETTLHQITINKRIKENKKLCNACAKIDYSNQLKSQLNKPNIDYSHIGLIENKSQKLKMYCKEHDLFFYQSWTSHINANQSCPKCGRRKANLSHMNVKSYLISKFKDVWGDEFNNFYYRFSSYKGVQKPMTIYCKKHKQYFSQQPINHLAGNYGCPKCRKYNTSRHEDVIESFLTKHNIEFIKNDRSLIKPYEIDFLIPKHSIGIELNGNRYHNENFKNKNYHKNKSDMALKKNYRLLHFFEDEIQYKFDIVTNIIKNNCGYPLERIYARKCHIVELTDTQYKDFLTANHIQGNRYTKIKLGLMLNNNLVMVMGVNKNELTRVSSLLGVSVIGGFAKLWKHYLNNYWGGQNITCFSEIRLFTGDMYFKNGFTYLGETALDYFWVKGLKRYSRYKCQKHKLANLLENGYNASETEIQNMTRNGFSRLFSCGHHKFIYTG